MSACVQLWDHFGYNSWVRIPPHKNALASSRIRQGISFASVLRGTAPKFPSPDESRPATALSGLSGAYGQSYATLPKAVLKRLHIRLFGHLDRHR